MMNLVFLVILWFNSSTQLYEMESYNVEPEECPDIAMKIREDYELNPEALLDKEFIDSGCLVINMER